MKYIPLSWHKPLTLQYSRQRVLQSTWLLYSKFGKHLLPQGKKHRNFTKYTWIFCGTDQEYFTDLILHNPSNYASNRWLEFAVKSQKCPMWFQRIWTFAVRYFVIDVAQFELLIIFSSCTMGQTQYLYLEMQDRGYVVVMLFIWFTNDWIYIWKNIVELKKKKKL